MKKLFGATVITIILLVLLTSSVFASWPNPPDNIYPDDVPSTNDQNKLNGAQYVEQIAVGPGWTTLNFVQPNSWWACFEYRTDGDITQALGVPNYNPAVPDLYPFVCENNSCEQKTFFADSFVEIRSVFGAERDDDFDWEKFMVLAKKILADEYWPIDPNKCPECPKTALAEIPQDGKVWVYYTGSEPCKQDLSAYWGCRESPVVNIVANNTFVVLIYLKKVDGVWEPQFLEMPQGGFTQIPPEDFSDAWWLLKGPLPDGFDFWTDFYNNPDYAEMLVDFEDRVIRLEDGNYMATISCSPDFVDSMMTDGVCLPIGSNATQLTTQLYASQGGEWGLEFNRDLWDEVTTFTSTVPKCGDGVVENPF